MAKILFLIAGVLCFFTVLNPEVIAHETNTIENIEATIHITPDDQPVAQQLSRIQISVKDELGQFNFARCECILEVIHDNNSVAELPLQGTGTTVETSFTFADSGQYSLLFISKNAEGNEPQFVPFELSYSYEVKPPPVSSPKAVNADLQDSEDNMFLIITGAIILSALAVTSVVIIIKKKNHQ